VLSTGTRADGQLHKPHPPLSDAALFFRFMTVCDITASVISHTVTISKKRATQETVLV
jgi:hypothetical protein